MFRLNVWFCELYFSEQPARVISKQLKYQGYIFGTLNVTISFSLTVAFQAEKYFQLQHSLKNNTNTYRCMWIKTPFFFIWISKVKNVILRLELSRRTKRSRKSKILTWECCSCDDRSPTGFELFGPRYVSYISRRRHDTDTIRRRRQSVHFNSIIL